MSVKRRDELDLVQYRLDALERRLESVERALLSKSDSGSINTELLNIVLSMVRNPSHTPSASGPTTTTQSAPVAPIEASTTQPAGECSTIGKSFMFDRRKTVV